MRKKCIPEGEQKSQGRGKGQGPMGVPTKEQKIMSDSDTLVDDILDGRYGKVKLIESAMDMVDIILDMSEKYNIREESGYQEYFKGMLQKFGVNSPNELEGEKKKQFFAAVSKGWKGKKGVAEVFNAIDHVPDEDADELLSNIEDELGCEEEDRNQLEGREFSVKYLIENAYDEVISEKALIYKAIASVELDNELKK